MKKRKRLSYDLSADAPGWPGNPCMSVEPYTQISEGAVCAHYLVTLFNHFGSHMDGAAHIVLNGEHLAAAPFETFFFDKPLLIDLPKGPLGKVTAADLEPYAGRIARADLLMIRTGFSSVRSTDPETYSQRGPSVSAEAASWLMENFRHNLKAIAVDFLSLGCPADLEDAMEAHRYMLGYYPKDDYIRIIEDICMEDLPADRLICVGAMPLFIKEIDSSPVTVWAEYDDDVRI